MNDAIEIEAVATVDGEIMEGVELPLRGTRYLVRTVRAFELFGSFGNDSNVPNDPNVSNDLNASNDRTLRTTRT